MHYSKVAHGLAIVIFPLVCFAGQLTIHPTTTLSSQTSNNTSAATGFVSQSNGNLGAANVSKVDIHSLLYSGASTKIYAHLMPWFGQANHMNIGYSSTDPAQVKRQIADMISRGIDGVIINWYGPNNSTDQATQLVMKEAEANPGFTFSIIVDKGAIQSDSCSTCSAQEILIRQLHYMEQTYFSSPAYMTIGGRAVVSNFDIDLFYTIDWSGAQAALATHPMFIFQNNNGFSHVISDGSYSWVIPTTSDYGAGYLESFYATGMLFPSKVTTGAAYKGFDDTLALWGSNRAMSQQCGHTWLQTFSEINRLHDSTRQLPILQLVTWNDYEEGTEIESGIDNCLSVSAGLSGNLLQWSVSGNEDTVHHYNVYISTDGQNLMLLASPASTLRSLDLCTYSLSSDSYTLYVQSIGKPGLKNQMSFPVAYNTNCDPGNAANLTALPSTLTIARGQSGTVQVSVVPQTGSFSNMVTFSCSNLPEGMVCSFSPSSVASGSASANTVLTISTMPVTVSVLQQSHGQIQTLIHAAGLFAFGLMGLFITCRARRIDRNRTSQILGTSAVLMTILMLSSCGGSAAPQVHPLSKPSAGTYTIMVNAVAGTTQATSSETVTIQ